jgi:hypothetical protein
LRDLTPKEEALASSINPHLSKAYGAWVDAGFSHAEIVEWWPVVRWRTKLPTDAFRLKQAGWTPTLVGAALDGAPVHNPIGAPTHGNSFTLDVSAVYSWHRKGHFAGSVDRHELVCWPGEVNATPSGRELVAYALLADYVATYHDAIAAIARDERLILMHAALNAGSTQADLARAFDLTAQRIHTMLRRPASLVPTTKVDG